MKLENEGCVQRNTGIIPTNVKSAEHKIDKLCQSIYGYDEWKLSSNIL